MSESTCEVVCLDVEKVASKGSVAWYRLDDGMFEFLKLCEGKYGIEGFIYKGTRTFGVMLSKAPEGATE